MWTCIHPSPAPRPQAREPLYLSPHRGQWPCPGASRRVSRWDECLGPASEPPHSPWLRLFYMTDLRGHSDARALPGFPPVLPAWATVFPCSQSSLGETHSPLTPTPPHLPRTITPVPPVGLVPHPTRSPSGPRRSPSLPREAQGASPFAHLPGRRIPFQCPPLPPTAPSPLSEKQAFMAGTLWP